MLSKFRGLLILAIVLGLIFVVFLSGAVSKNAALSVSSDPAGQKILLDNKEAGVTPYLSDQLEAGNPVLSFGSFNQKIRLTAGALTVVNWVLGPSETFSAGEVVWFSESSTGSELVVITNPVAEVFLNGESLGESPLSKPLSVGEYDLEIKKGGYFPRKIKIAVKESLRLNVSARLALQPFPEEPRQLSAPSPNLIVWDLSGIPSLASTETASDWVSGAVFWSSRMEEPAAYDFFLTAGGKLYDATGSEVSLESLTQISDRKTVGYLSDAPGALSSAASTTLNSLASRLYPAPPQVKILDTGIGYLKVRSGPGKSYSEIGRANVGATYTYLGEQSGWYKISFGGGEGWVSSDYSKKL